MDEREKQIRSLLSLVRRIAARVHRMVPRAEIADLVGDGSIGLIRAVDAFDPVRGPSLEHYASKIILGAMLNGLRRMDPVPERARRTLRRARRERYRLAVARGSMPSKSEMTKRDPQIGRAAYSVYRSAPLSLDAPLPMGEHLPLTLGEDPGTIAVEQDERDYLRALVDAVPERQRRVMLAHYYGQVSLRSIGAQWRISPQRASQIHLAAIARLRKVVDDAAYRS